MPAPGLIALPTTLPEHVADRPAIPFARGLRDTIAWDLARPAWPA